MRGVFASRSGIALVKSPSSRQLAARRRALVACGVLVLALASGAVGVLSHRQVGLADRAEPLGKPHTGPFSYFPSQ
jgi:hypothetical protein